MQKDLAMSYYYKRDYEKALDEVKILMDRDDADVVAFQIAGNVYKALEEVKEAEKVYKRGLKKFPGSGALYSEFGELLWEKKDFSAIEQWETGIRVDPTYSGNYYNAARYYFYTKDKIWALIYGEIFVNMESLSDRGNAMKQLLLQAYKEKLFADADLMAGQEKNKSEFARAFLECMSKQSSLANRGITTETLTMIRTRFILDWFDKYAGRFPYKLFDYQRQLIQEGIFNAYNEWLFGTVEDLATYERPGHI
jgi:tetratricopeptide (TPR) repeat protein